LDHIIGEVEEKVLRRLAEIIQEVEEEQEPPPPLPTQEEEVPSMRVVLVFKIVAVMVGQIPVAVVAVFRVKILLVQEDQVS